MPRDEWQLSPNQLSTTVPLGHRATSQSIKPYHGMRGSAVVDPSSLATRGTNMDDSKEKTKGDDIPKPQEEEQMETDVEAGKSAPIASPINSEQEREILKSSSQDESEIRDGERPRRKLAGSQRKRLSKLIKSGTPYQTALMSILKQREEKQRQHGVEQSPQPAKHSNRPDKQKEGDKSNSQYAGAGKRIRSVGSTPEQCAKKARSDPPRYRDIAAGERVGLTHPEFPSKCFTHEQLTALQQAVLKAVNEMTEDGPQVRFQSCSHRPGWLQITCADEESQKWLEDASKHLQPWEGATVRFLRAKDLPKPHVCVAYLPDDTPDQRLSPETALLRLRRMNHGLNTREWIVLHREDSGPGQTWTFAIDDTSMVTLRGLEFRPYFGFGQVRFRPRQRAADGQASGSSGDQPPRGSKDKGKPLSGKGKAIPGKVTQKKKSKSWRKSDGGANKPPPPPPPPPPTPPSSGGTDGEPPKTEEGTTA